MKCDAIKKLVYLFNLIEGERKSVLLYIYIYMCVCVCVNLTKKMD